jgi:hypothetical protein
MVEGKVGGGVGGGCGLGWGEWDRMRGTTVILTVHRVRTCTVQHYNCCSLLLK